MGAIPERIRRATSQRADVFELGMDGTHYECVIERHQTACMLIGMR